MKKTILSVLMILTLALCAVMMFACAHKHELTEVAGKDATCTADGIIAHKHCDKCGKDFDLSGKELTTTVIPAAHKLTDVSYLAPQPTADGHIAHKHCTVCGKNFNDSGKELTDDEVNIKYNGGGVNTVTVTGDKDVAISLGGQHQFQATATPAGTAIVWTVTSTNLAANDYTFADGKFTAKQVAGWAVIKAQAGDATAFATIVINDDVTPTQRIIATFYAPDGTTVVDKRFADADGKVTPPDYTQAHADITWLDAHGRDVDFETLVLTADASFTAKASERTEQFRVSYWYYNDENVLVQVGETHTLASDYSESVPAATVAEYKAEVEQATGGTVINWKQEISDGGYTIKLIAEVQLPAVTE